MAVLLLVPGSELPSGGPPLLDKAAHLLLFAIHCVLLARAMAVRQPAGGATAAAALVSALYAVALETAQIRVPGRKWELLDLAAGLIGIGLAVVLVLRLRARVFAD